METKRRTAYFGTNGCPGHYFSAISGEFSPQEEEELSKIDEDFQLFGFSGFNFFYYKGYGCLSFSASPDDNRSGSKTVFFVEDARLKTEVLEALEESPFRTKFDRTTDFRFQIALIVCVGCLQYTTGLNNIYKVSDTDRQVVTYLCP